jgi:hypothetical protein
MALRIRLRSMGQQNRVAESRTASRGDAKPDPLQSCRLAELRGEGVENGTQPYRKVELTTRSLTQPQRLDELAQHAGQLRRGLRGLRQLFPLLAAVKVTGELIVRSDDQLQRLS